MVSQRIHSLYELAADLTMVARAAWDALNRGCTAAQCTAALAQLRAQQRNERR